MLVQRKLHLHKEEQTPLLFHLMPMPSRKEKLLHAITSIILISQCFGLSNSNHDSNVAVLVSSSTFFHNYRHTSNTLVLYHSLKKYGGFTDDNIILFLGDEVACNARNPFKDTIYPYPNHEMNLFENVQVDYSGSDVTVENFFRVLLGRHASDSPSNKKLPIDENSKSGNESKINLLLYITGHGGDSFFKFRDQEDFTTTDLRGAFEQMQIMKRFNSVLFISDTCQAFTLAPNTNEENKKSGLTIQNVYTIGSSLKGESSYAHHSDRSIGHSVMDRYVHYFLEHMGGLNAGSGSNWYKMKEMSVKEAMVDSMYYRGTMSKKLGVDVGWSDLGCEIEIDDIPLSDFMEQKQNDNDLELIVDKVQFW